jgi:hypothetical protein
MRVADAVAVDMTLRQAIFGLSCLALGARPSKSDPIFFAALRLMGSGLCFSGEAKIDDVSHDTNGVIKTGEMNMSAPALPEWTDPVLLEIVNERAAWMQPFSVIRPHRG